MKLTTGGFYGKNAEVLPSAYKREWAAALTAVFSHDKVPAMSTQANAPADTLYVRAEMTPNPQTLRFVTNQQLTEHPTEFKNVNETVSAPLARKLFGFPWTQGVYIGRDFVAVTKQDWVDWETLAEPLAGLIQEHLERGEAVMMPRTAAADAASVADSSGDSDDVRTIKAILDREIRPAVALDGGDIVFHKFEDGVVSLFMQGACAGCPSSTMTLKQGIETRLKEAVPAVREVISI